VAGEVTDEGVAVVRVAVVDDHPVVREGTAALLAAQPGIVVSGTAGSLEEARQLLAETDADVVLLDIRLGKTSGLTLLADGPAAQEPARQRPAVIVLTAYDYPQYAEAALRMGAAGFVLKTAPMADLLSAIRRAAAGGLAFDIRPDATARIRLSRRELQVVQLVADGRSNDEVGAALGIGAKTVETHLARLYERFGISSRTELATRALREGWLDLPPDAGKP
jgi:DNA-binding NarL/FixJ family response regulator